MAKKNVATAKKNVATMKKTGNKVQASKCTEKACGRSKFAHRPTSSVKQLLERGALGQLRGANFYLNILNSYIVQRNINSFDIAWKNVCTNYGYAGQQRTFRNLAQEEWKDVQGAKFLTVLFRTIQYNKTGAAQGCADQGCCHCHDLGHNNCNN